MQTDKYERVSDTTKSSLVIHGRKRFERIKRFEVMLQPLVEHRNKAHFIMQHWTFILLLPYITINLIFYLIYPN